MLYGVCSTCKYSFVLVLRAILSKLRNRKSRLFKKFVRSGTDIDYALYSRARADFRRCYEEYMIRVRSNFVSDPKSFYDFV